MTTRDSNDRRMPMNLPNVETIKIKGVVYEIVNSAARRYGVSAQVIQEHFGKELFRATDPRTGINMICGALPDEVVREYREGEKVRITPGAVMEFLFACPTNRFLPNLLWLGIWSGISSLIGSMTELMVGVAVAVFVGVVKLCFVLKYEMEHPKKKVVGAGAGMSFADMDALYYGGSGGGFFDEVSTRRRSDLQFLLGTGPFAQ